MDWILGLFFLACIVMLVSVMTLNTRSTRDVLDAIAEDRPLPRQKQRASLPHLLFVLVAIPMLPIGLRLGRTEGAIVFAAIALAPAAALLVKQWQQHRDHADVRRALAAGSGSDAPEAIRLLEAAIDQQGATAPRLTALAEWQGVLGRWETALANAELARKQQPAYRQAYLVQIEALRQLQRLDEADRIAAEMIDNDREDWDAYVARCLIKLQGTDVVDGIADYHKLTRYLPRWYRKSMPETARRWWTECETRIQSHLQAANPTNEQPA